VFYGVVLKEEKASPSVMGTETFEALRSALGRNSRHTLLGAPRQSTTYAPTIVTIDVYTFRDRSPPRRSGS